VLGTGIFFAIKWHFDQAQKEKKMDKRQVATRGQQSGRAVRPIASGRGALHLRPRQAA
jgi:hypothetical protein